MDLARPASPNAEPDDAWREKQRQLADARARLLAAKNGDASAAAPPAPPPSSLLEPRIEAPRAEVEPALECSLPEVPAAELREQASAMATQLGEAADGPGPSGIHVLLQRQGEAFVREHIAKAREVEAAGGMLTLDGDRRRTLGGVFFALAKKTLGDPIWHQLFPLPPKKRPPSARASVPTHAAPPATKTTPPGEARTVKVTLVGRPGPVAMRDTYIETTMVNRKAPDFPKGLPAPPKEPSHWRVFVAKKTWARVEAALAADPTDSLVVEGWGAFDVTAGVMTAYALNATTAALQRAAKAAKPAQGTP